MQYEKYFVPRRKSSAADAASNNPWTPAYVSATPDIQKYELQSCDKYELILVFNALFTCFCLDS